MAVPCLPAPFGRCLPTTADPHDDHLIPLAFAERTDACLVPELWNESTSGEGAPWDDGSEAKENAENPTEGSLQECDWLENLSKDPYFRGLQDKVLEAFRRLLVRIICMYDTLAGKTMAQLYCTVCTPARFGRANTSRTREARHAQKLFRCVT